MIGIVADDITGANDIGIMFAKSGCLVDVYAYSDMNRLDHAIRRPDVLILDTDSRFDNAPTAYRKVYEATRKLQSMGAEQFYNKTCSVFRGNIGAEFDAMLDALGEEFAAVVLGFPKNGRVTQDGVHYVHGKLLEQSEFRHDPMHPMTQSDLTNILQAQTGRRVTSISHERVRQGADALRRELKGRRADYSYAIIDVTDQADLATIAQAVSDSKVWCGSSGLAEELAKRRPAAGGATSTGKRALPPYNPAQGLLIAAGSLMPQTAAQIAYMRRQDMKTFALNTLRLFDDAMKQQTIAERTALIIEEINRGASVIVHSANDAERVERTKAAGARAGFSDKEISRLVSGTIAEITYRVLQQTGLRRFVIAGGDTSAAVCRRLAIQGMTVWREIQPGLPSCISISDDPMLFVLKSGSFGTADFFEKALAHLRQV